MNINEIAEQMITEELAKIDQKKLRAAIKKELAQYLDTEDFSDSLQDSLHDAGLGWEIGVAVAKKLIPQIKKLDITIGGK